MSKKKQIFLQNIPPTGEGIQQLPNANFETSESKFLPNERRKLVLIGSFSVGKTALASRIVHDNFSDYGKATIGADQLSVNVVFGSTNVIINVWDTSGDEKYSDITKTFYRGADLIIICYDITSKKSFNDVNLWKERADSCVSQVPLFLVGCKADLLNREVSHEEAVNKAKELGMEFFETSAKEKTQILELTRRAAFVACSHEKIEKVQKVVLSSDNKTNNQFDSQQSNKEKQKCC